MSAGYSGTPLLTKLGIRAGMRLAFLDTPAQYRKQLGPLPFEVTELARCGRNMDFVHWFVRRASQLARFATLAGSLAPTGMLWASWTKKSSLLYAGFGDAEVRAAGLATGLVDVKVCAVDEDWSGLRFVVRREDRR